MTESLKNAIQAALLRMLSPLVKWLLDAGIGVGEFQTLVRIAYVRAACEQGVRSGAEPRKPNISRVAIVTGLTRPEVRRIVSSEPVERPHDRQRRQRAERVLSGWWNDRDFQDSSGNPATLALRRGGRSFAALASRYSGVSGLAAPILDELLRVKAVRRLPDGRLRAISRTTATVRWSAEGLAAFGEQLKEHCATLLHNLRNPAHPLYVRRVINARLDPRYVPMLRRDIEQQTDALADALDDALNDPQQTPRGAGSTDLTSLGVAFYVFEAEDMEGAEPEETRPAKRTRKILAQGRRGKAHPPHRTATRIQ